MNRLITRPLVVLGVSGVALGIALTPIEVSAAEAPQTTVTRLTTPLGSAVDAP